MKNFLLFFSLKTGVYLIGFHHILALMSNLSSFYSNARDLKWIEYYLYFFNLIRIIMSFYFFLIMLMKNNVDSRYNFYLAYFVNTVSSILYAPFTWNMLIEGLQSMKYDYKTIKYYFFICISSYFEQIYALLICRSYVYEKEKNSIIELEAGAAR
jgi:hypothetical protein